MVALSGAEKAAVVAFLKSRRGQRALHADVVNALATFFESPPRAAQLGRDVSAVSCTLARVM